MVSSPLKLNKITSLSSCSNYCRQNVITVLSFLCQLCSCGIKIGPLFCEFIPVLVRLIDWLKLCLNSRTCCRFDGQVKLTFWPFHVPGSLSLTTRHHVIIFINQSERKWARWAGNIKAGYIKLKLYTSSDWPTWSPQAPPWKASSWAFTFHLLLLLHY